jgi:dephospho-CoA kinase
MITVAVTGGIGAGKSTVSRALHDRGAVVIDSDRLARDVVAPGTPGLAAIAEAFGPAVIGADGALDRAALGATVFADQSARRRLEGITHPLVRARFRELRRAAPPDSVVVNDIPLLTTLEVAASFHLVIGVVADPEVRLQRLEGRGLAPADARARMAAQLSDDERAAFCDVMIHNHGDVDVLDAAVADLWTRRLVPFESNVRAGRPAARGGAPRLVPADPAWAATGARLAARVSAAAGGSRVDHIGSTAVPGMPAKDVIDLQLTVPDLGTADDLAPALAAAGFPRLPGVDRDEPHAGNALRADDEPDRWAKRLHRNADPGQGLNLHVRVRDAPNWRWSLLFRDWLKAEPDEFDAYLALKEQATARHVGDATTDGYALTKEPWITAAYPRGLSWAERTGWSPGAD